MPLGLGQQAHPVPPPRSVPADLRAPERGEHVGVYHRGPADPVEQRGEVARVIAGDPGQRGTETDVFPHGRAPVPLPGDRGDVPRHGYCCVRVAAFLGEVDREPEQAVPIAFGVADVGTGEGRRDRPALQQEPALERGPEVVEQPVAQLGGRAVRAERDPQVCQQPGGLVLPVGVQLLPAPLLHPVEPVRRHRAVARLQRLAGGDQLPEHGDVVIADLHEHVGAGAVGRLRRCVGAAGV